MTGVVCGCTTLDADRSFDLGPVITRDRSVEGHDRLRAAGPLYEQRRADDGASLSALRPLYSRVEDPARRRVLRDYLWPLGMIKTLDGDTYWRFGIAYGNDFDPEPRSRYRTVVLPLFFAGRDRHGEAYAALFPLVGRIHEFLGLDRIGFFLFPLYLHTSIKDIETYSYVWPVFSRTEGARMHRVRAFPFYGRSTRDDAWERRFVLWPLWTSVRYTDAADCGAGFLLFPLYGHARYGENESWAWLPPFFRRTVSPDQTSLYCPWPFIQHGTGKIEKFYLWPLWGRKSVANVDSGFALWPIVHHSTIERPDHIMKRRMVLPFFYGSARVLKSRAPAGADGEGDADDPSVAGRYMKVWPLLSYDREKEASRLRMPSLWPGRDPGGVERNLTPLWTLYSRARSADAAEHELLWGLFRHRRESGDRRVTFFPFWSSQRSEDGSTNEWSVLFGLVGRRREGARTEYRLLYGVKLRSGE